MTELALSSGVLPLQDTAAVLSRAPFEGVDSVVIESPLPGGVAAIVRTLLNTVPWWVQLGGIVLGAVVGVVLVVLLIRHRRRIVGWVGSRHRPIQLALALGLIVVLLAAGRFSTAAWNYTQHDNGFCTGCHVMAPAFQEFANFKDRHDTLSCHDCHQQPITASLRQLYLWIAERPAEIGPHAKVPNAVCMKCHVVEGDTATWQRIASTAGHRVHLQSDSASLKDLQCVTCHGVEVHRFVPAPATCGQTGCHEPEQTRIVLGKMAGQVTSHCTTCHQFTADVPLLATRDSARRTLVPASAQCLGCHEMRAVLAEFDVALEPHGGSCGTCHNPHQDSVPRAAITTCAAAGCHADWRNEPFHVGREHRRTGEACQTCHLPHRSKVDASDCQGCHAAVRQRTGRQPPLPFDTLRALRRISYSGDSPGGPAFRGVGSEPPEDVDSGGFVFGSAGWSEWPEPAPRDTFPHARHRALACLTCHTARAGHGGLTFVPPRGCDICHHQAPAASRCATCHQPGELEAPRHVTARVTVPDHPPRPREVAFSHQTHQSRRCVECHTTPVSLAVSAEVVECRSCHEAHHAVDRSCRACHSTADIRTVHPDAQTVHQRCDACHTRTTVAELTPTRSFCATCHEAQQTRHHEPKECTVCHFLSEPASFRARLLAPPGGV